MDIQLGKEYIFVPRKDAKPHVQACYGRTVVPVFRWKGVKEDCYSVDLSGPMVAFTDELVDPDDAS